VLKYGSVPVAVATMGHKHVTLVDGSARVCELVRYFCA